jgi:hypothetical protein
MHRTSILRDLVNAFMMPNNFVRIKVPINYRTVHKLSTIYRKSLNLFGQEKASKVQKLTGVCVLDVFTQCLCGVDWHRRCFL